MGKFEKYGGKLEKLGIEFADKKDEKKFKGMPEEEKIMAEKIYLQEKLEKDQELAKNSLKANQEVIASLKEDITRGLTETLDKADKVIKPAQTKAKTPSLNMHGDGYGTIGDMARITTEDKEKTIEIPSKKKDGLKSTISLNSALEKNKKGIDTVSNILEIYKNKEEVVVKSEKLRKNISGKIIHIDNDGSVTVSRTNKDGSTQSESFSAEDIIKWKNEGVKADEVLETLKPTESIVKKSTEKKKENRTEKITNEKEEQEKRKERILKIFNDKEEVVVNYNGVKNVSARIVRVRNNGDIEVSYKTGKGGRVVDGLFSTKDIIKWKDEGLKVSEAMDAEKPIEKSAIVPGAVAKETIPVQVGGIVPKKEKSKAQRIEELKNVQAELQKKEQEKEKSEKGNMENMKFNSREMLSGTKEMPSRVEKEILIRKHLEEKKIANKDIEITKPIFSEIKLEEKSSAEFGIPKPEKVLGNEEVDLEKKSAPVVENVKEKAENLLRENFVRAQLDLEKARKAGGYDTEDFKSKKAPFEKDFDEAKKVYFEFLKNNEGFTNEEKGKFVFEEFNKLQDIKIDLRSKEESEKAYFPTNIIKEVGNWYKEQSSKQKYIVAGALIGTGAIAAFMGLGGAVALPLGLAITVSRALSGAGTAVALETAIAQGKGKKFGMHIGHKGLMEERTAEEIEKIKKGVTVESAADFFEKNEEALGMASEKLYKESKKLETERAIVAGAAGAIIATGAFGEAIKNVMHWTGADKAMKGAFDWTKEHLGFGGHKEAAGAVGLNSQNIEAQQAALAESENIKNLATIRKGEGVIHVFQRQLEDNPAKFGFTGDINNPAEVDKWVHQKAYDIAIKEGYIAEKGEVIVSGTQRVLEKEPLHYGFTGDVNNADEVRKWAMKEAGDVAAKTGTDVPGVLETRVKWDYSQSPENQATFTLSPDGKVTEAISSVKHPEYLYDSTGVSKTKEGLDLINAQIDESDANIEKLNIDVAKEARRRLATGMGSFHAEKELNEAVANADVLAAEKVGLEDKLKFQSGVSQAASESGYRTGGVNHTEIKGDKFAEKVSHIETQFNRDNALLLKEIPSGLKESLINSSTVDLGRIEPEFDKLDFEHQNKVIHFLDDRAVNAHAENIGESAVLSEKLSEHLSQNHSYLKNMTEFLGEKAGFKFDAGLLDKIKNMGIDDLQKSIKTMALTKGSNWGGGLTLSNRHLGAYEDLSEFMKDHGFKGGKQKISEVLGKIATDFRNK